MIREVVERSSTAAEPPRPISPSSHGFPTAKHRSKGRPMANAVAGPSRLPSNGQAGLQADATSLRTQRFQANSTDADRSYEAENEARVQAMSPAERQQEIEELIERFGDGLKGLMAKRRAEKGKEKETTSTVPQAIGISTHRGSAASIVIADTERDYVESRAEQDKIAWMRTSSSTTEDQSLRFDLSGKLLSGEDMISISTSSGLHHHGHSPDLAGYSMDEILLLCRSSVPSQRVHMLKLLAKVIGNYGSSTGQEEVKALMEREKVVETAMKMAEDILIAPKSPGLQMAAVDLLCESFRGSDTLDTFQPDSRISSLEWTQIIPSLKGILKTSLKPLFILRRLAIESQESADLLIHFLPDVMKRVTDRPYPIEPSEKPCLKTLRLVNELVRSSRQCAVTLLDNNLVIPLLRFFTPDLWTSDYEVSLAIEVLHLLRYLSRYGLGASLALTFEMMSFDPLPLAQATAGLTMAYFGVLELWVICAIDPHRTTPEHSLLWSQIPTRWYDQAVKVISQDRDGAELCAALHFVDTWLTGLETNSVDKGQREKEKILSVMKELELERLLQSQDIELLCAIVPISGKLKSAGTLLTDGRLEKLWEGTKESQARLRSALLQNVENTDQTTYLGRVLEVLRETRPGQEPTALSLLDRLLGTGPQSSIDSKDESGLGILRPLLQYTILPAEGLVGPMPPDHRYLKVTTTLRSPSSASDRIYGLPLRPDWIFSPLDELLRSADSKAIAQAPPDWTPSEVEIVRETLSLAVKQREVLPQSLSASLLLFNLMKVFMLEKEQDNNTSTEVFRDSTVSKLLSTLLQPVTVPSDQSATTTPRAEVSLETVSKDFLGNDTPFYQFYADFVGLYEAISYSDKVFTQLLLPPLAMNYPVDFRRVIWVDNPAILRNLTTKSNEVPLESTLDTFFEPIETDPDVLAGFVRGLSRGWVRQDRNEFMWKIAVHHLAKMFWTESGVDSAVRKSLMGAIMNTAPGDVKKAILEYDEGNSVGSSSDIARKLDIVASVLGKETAEKLQHGSIKA